MTARSLVYAASGARGNPFTPGQPYPGSARFLTSAVSVSGIAITPGGDAIVTDRGANEVFAIWDVAGGAVRRLLADTREGVSSPAGVAVSSGNRIYVANPGSATVGARCQWPFPQGPSAALARSPVCISCGDSVFRLTDGIHANHFPAGRQFRRRADCVCSATSGLGMDMT